MAVLLRVMRMMKILGVDHNTADVDLLVGLLKENYQDDLDKLVKSINSNTLGKLGKL